MADIATLGVRVTSTGIKEAERDLKDLTKEGARAEGQADKLGSAWGKRLGVAVLAGTAVLGTAITKIVRNTIEAERVQAQLAARVRSTGGAAGLAVADLNKMADALQAATTFDDEAIGGAQSVLLTFTKIGKDVFPQATEAVLNLSTALGTDLNSASLQVGKALNDPVAGISALARAGVQFTAAQKDTIKALVETGQQAEAQRIILAELETQIGGSARAARETLGGALQALSNAFNNALEGDSGSDGARGLTQAVNDLTDTLNSPETKEGFAVVVGGLLDIAKFGAETITALGGVAEMVNQWFKAAGDKSFQGLIQEQIRLEDLIAKRAQGSTAGGGPFERRIDVDKRLKDQLAEILRLQDEIVRNRNGAALAAESGGSSGSPNGRGRGVRVTDDPTVGAPVNQPAIERATGATRALSEASRDAAQAQREIEAQARAAEAAQASFLAATENLRAELGGPFARVQLDYIRREDELIDLARAAGLGQEDLAASLGLLEEARLRDVDAIEQQIEAERARAQAIADQPLIDQLDGLRDTTQGFFVDLVKNGEDAIDRLQDYLLTSALESIGKQIAEGLFGDFGTTSTGSAGGGIASFFTSLLGFGRAAGGPVNGGKLYPVAERGQPELLQMHGRKYLIPGGAGEVTPLREGSDAGGPTVVNQTIQVTGTITASSAYQLQREAAMRQQMASRR